MDYYLTSKNKSTKSKAVPGIAHNITFDKNN